MNSAAHTIDTSEFTRRGETSEGELPVSALPRLASVLLDDTGSIRWRLAGRVDTPADGRRHPALGLSLDGTAKMQCVRCLEPVEVPISAQRDYRLADSESQAAREDADDDVYDVLVGSRRFDVAALVEDEAIMAVPLAARHDACRAPEVGPDPAATEAEARPNPFALLQQLRDDSKGRG